ncbi:MAG: hypothetical protein ACI4WR_07680 [Bulleidia sp.]
MKLRLLILLSGTTILPDQMADGSGQRFRENFRRKQQEENFRLITDLQCKGPSLPAIEAMSALKTEKVLNQWGYQHFSQCFAYRCSPGFQCVLGLTAGTVYRINCRIKLVNG